MNTPLLGQDLLLNALTSAGSLLAGPFGDQLLQVEFKAPPTLPPMIKPSNKGYPRVSVLPLEPAYGKRHSEQSREELILVGMFKFHPFPACQFVVTYTARRCRCMRSVSYPMGATAGLLRFVD